MQSDLFASPTENLLPYDGEAYYYKSFLPKEDANRYLNLLKQEIEWKQEPIKIFGKEVMQPRLTALYGNPNKVYRYSGIEMLPLPWNDFLMVIKERIEGIAQAEFTHVLLNYYRDGQDSMGWHRDNELSLGKTPTIASVSFGAVREFQMRYYQDKSKKVKLPLEDGSLLLMSGLSQQFWEHQIPKTSKSLPARINLTFRKIIT